MRITPQISGSGGAPDLQSGERALPVGGIYLRPIRAIRRAPPYIHGGGRQQESCRAGRGFISPWGSGGCERVSVAPGSPKWARARRSAGAQPDPQALSDVRELLPPRSRRPCGARPYPARILRSLLASCIVRGVLAPPISDPGEPLCEPRTPQDLVLEGPLPHLRIEGDHAARSHPG